MSLDPKELMSLPEAGRLVGVSRVTVWRWVRAGRLGSVQIGNRPYVLRSQVRLLSKDRKSNGR